MEDTAALLGSSAIKQRLAGVTGLLEQLRRQDAAPEASATLIPHVLPCLRDHNSKIALGALEILQLLVSRVAESTLRSYFKLLWLSLVERLGDSKLPVREKAVDVVVEISVVLDVDTVLDKLKGCMGHKNWRTREQSLHAVWRCLERQDLFREKQDELLDDVLKLLEDSSKDVRDAAITALEKFYMSIGASLLSDLEYKNIRPSQVKTLTGRFERIPVRGNENRAVTPSYDDRSNQDNDDAPAQGDAAPEKLSSILSSYDLQVSSSSSSVARYLASVRSRTNNEAKAMADVSGDGDRSPSQASSTSSKVVQASTFGSGGGDISEKEIQKQLGVIFDKLHLDNNWDKRVGGLKMLQKLTKRCRSASNSGNVLPLLSQGLRPIRERLCQQVTDLRSSVSREACQAIETLANTLRDEFNAHAEIFLGYLLKATYVTIQVISTSADTTIRSMIESTSNGYARVIPKLIECAKSRNQVLRYNAVCYLTMTLQRWSTSFLSKHSDMFVPILPVILLDALGDVRATSRKCYWSFHHLFPDEADGVFARLDGTTQKNLKDDPSKFTAKTARQTEFSSMNDAAAPQAVDVARSALRTAVQPPISAPAASSSVTFSDEQPRVQRVLSSGELVSEKLPRRDGSNMKVKAAMCHYLRDLLPGAGEYLKHGANNSHMRSFLLKIALLMDTDVPVSVSSACSELVSIAAQLYGPEMEVALGLLPPSKRLVVSKVLKSKKIVLNFSNTQRPPLSSSAAPHSARSRDGEDDDNQDMEFPAPRQERSRKRPESPSVRSSSPARQNSQKRINTAAQVPSPVIVKNPKTDDRASRQGPVKRPDEMTSNATLSGHPVLSTTTFSSAAADADKHDVQLDELLLLLEKNNLSEAEIKHALYKTLHFIETGSSATWDRCFGRLLLLLLDAATDKDVHALKVLQKLVEAQPTRAQMFFELLLQRLIDAIGDQVDVARHLMERILHDLVSFASDHQQTLSTLVPLVPRVDPPALQVVLRLVKVCLQACERTSPQDAVFLRKPDIANSLMKVLTRRLDHASSSVRKNAVDCLVAFHFATKEDNSIVPKYLAAELDDTRRRLVEIFIDRAKVDRHPVGLST
ncbi:hypothetical protein PR001_g3514 [Phytophthora rubi]|uniref:TOG domain-containing protein n=1 Tax=Phytophthora rubi TaxID=129364 RepID=A0A6A3P1M3_9STRA|nr:hypothetical protein PR001_g3514 [Phytophthora rubi]